MVTEKFVSCRLIEDEANYIRDFWENKFSDFVHSSIKHEIQQIKVNKSVHRMQLLKDWGLYMILISMGCIFFLFGLTVSSIGVRVFCYLIGMIMGGFGVVGGVLIALQCTRKKC